MNALAAVANSPTSFAEPQGLIRRVADWMSRAPAEARAQAVSALARAFLYSGLEAPERAEAMIALTSALDDSSVLVRRALAEALASATEAPRHIVLSLAQDRAEVARVVLARSPVLSDADLVDSVALGDVSVQVAVARRAGLGAAVSAALAEVGAAAAALALTENLEARIDPAALRRLFERFGEDAVLREALLRRPGLPAALRADIAGAVAAALVAFTSGRGWLETRRAERVAREAREQTVVAIAQDAGADLGGLVARLREDRALTVALLMRALMSGERGLFCRALSDLSGIDERRVAAFLSDPQGRGFAAVYAKAGMPAVLLPGFRAALAAQAGEAASCGVRLSHAITTRTIGLLERLNDPALAPLLAMLWRFAGESARADARAHVASFEAAPEAPLLRLEPGAFATRPPPPVMLDLTPASDLEDQLALLIEQEFAVAA